MHGLAFALLIFALSSEPSQVVYDGGDTQKDQGLDAQVVEETVDLTKGVFTINSREILIGFLIKAVEAEQVESVRLYVSGDGGKTWKCHETCKPAEKVFSFTAPRDGVYLLATQVVYKDGKCSPQRVDKHAAMLKVSVETERKVLKPE